MFPNWKEEGQKSTSVQGNKISITKIGKQSQEQRARKNEQELCKRGGIEISPERLNIIVGFIHTLAYKFRSHTHANKIIPCHTIPLIHTHTTYT